MKRVRTSAVLSMPLQTKEPKDFQEIKFVDEIPKSAPLSSFVRFPNETCDSHNIYSNTELTASKNVSDIRTIEEKVKKIDEALSQYYSQRSIMTPLQKYVMTNPESAKQVAQIAMTQIDPLVKLINYTKNAVTESILYLTTILAKAEIWKNGLYSNELLFSLCTLIHRIFLFDKIKTVKNSVKNDATIACRLAALADSSSSSANTLENLKVSWLDDNKYIDNKITETFTVISQDLMMTISNIFYTYIINRLNGNSDILLFQDNFILRIALAFFVSKCSSCIPQTEIPNLVTIFSQVPYIPLYFEFGFNIIRYLQTLQFFKGVTFSALKDPNPKDYIIEARRNFADISLKLQELCSTQVHFDAFTKESILQLISKAISLISTTTALLRQQYTQKLEEPPEEPANMKAYERSVRFGYSSHPADLKNTLQLLSLCRELHDMLRLCIPSIYPKICSSIHSIFQDFIKNGLEFVSLHAKHEKKQVANVVDTLRVLAGDWVAGEDPLTANKDNRKSSEMKERSIPVRSSAPSSQLIEFVRIQVAHMLTPDGVFMKASSKITKRGNAFGESGEKKLADFLNVSTNWIYLLSLDQTLSSAADQSAFYFKEVQLDLNGSVQFPARSSLPFILMQFALDSIVQPEIAEIVFYPLSIYDDAANIAQNYFRSQLMMDEIEAESRVAVSTLSVLMGEYTFNSYLTFAALKQLPDKIVDKLKQNHARHWPKSQAYRLRTLLQQNRFCLLSKQIDLKSVIAPRVDQEVNTTVEKLFDLAKDYGVVASLAIDRVLNIISESHRLLVENGLPLMPFQDIVQSVKHVKSPESFNSFYVRYIVSHLTHQLIRKYALTVSPLIFFPPKKVLLPAEKLGKNVLGKILKDALDNTVSFVTVQHFSVFMRNISDGTVVIIAKAIKSNVEKSLTHFLNCYATVNARLTRIKDAPFGTSLHEAFTRYEGAYKYFLKDKDFLNLIRTMQILGNTFAVAEVIDQALSVKEFNVLQVLGYLRSVNENGKPLDEIENLFDDKFKEAIKIITARPMKIAVDTNSFMLNVALQTFISSFEHGAKDLFDPKPVPPNKRSYNTNTNINTTPNSNTSTNTNINNNDNNIDNNNFNVNYNNNNNNNNNNNDFNANKGILGNSSKNTTTTATTAMTNTAAANSKFACVWSVVEFVFCLMESLREENDITGFMKYGQGVVLCAALVLQIMDQVDLAKLQCIGRKLQRHRTVDISGIEDNVTVKFLAVSKYELSAFEWAVLFFQPYIRKIMNK